MDELLLIWCWVGLAEQVQLGEFINVADDACLNSICAEAAFGLVGIAGCISGLRLVRTGFRG